jgi:hypothetical protein
MKTALNEHAILAALTPRRVATWLDSVPATVTYAMTIDACPLACYLHTTLRRYVEVENPGVFVGDMLGRGSYATLPEWAQRFVARLDERAGEHTSGRLGVTAVRAVLTEVDDA